MAYADFSLPQIKQQFHITTHDDTRLFSAIIPIELSATLVTLLAENVPLALTIDTEKARSEFIIAPIMAEYRRIFKHRFSLFSGIDFTVDTKQGLNGVCDCIISRSLEQFYLSASVLVLVEAKNSRIKDGIPQCIAEMIAAHVFNEQQGAPLPTTYGIVSTGSLWRFLKLTDREVWIDCDEYHIREVRTIFAIMVYMGEAEPVVLDEHPARYKSHNVCEEISVYQNCRERKA